MIASPCSRFLVNPGFVTLSAKCIISGCAGRLKLTESVNVGVVNLGAEEAFGGDHWIVVREEQLKVEHATFIWGVSGAGNLDEEVAAVGL